MKNSSLAVVVWLAIVAHVVVAAMVKTRWTERPLLVALNLVVALCTLAYWIPRWYSYATKGIMWYASDQLIPLYALVVCVLSALALTGQYRGALPHWMVFAIDVLALAAFALFMGTFKM